MQVTNVQNSLEMAIQKPHIVVWRRCKLVTKSILNCKKRKDTCGGEIHVQQRKTTCAECSRRLHAQQQRNKFMVEGCLMGHTYNRDKLVTGSQTCGGGMDRQSWGISLHKQACAHVQARRDQSVTGRAWLGGACQGLLTERHSWGSRLVLRHNVEEGCRKLRQAVGWPTTLDLMRRHCRCCGTWPTACESVPSRPQIPRPLGKRPGKALPWGSLVVLSEAVRWREPAVILHFLPSGCHLLLLDAHEFHSSSALVAGVHPWLIVTKVLEAYKTSLVRKKSRTQSGEWAVFPGIYQASSSLAFYLEMVFCV